MDDCASDGQYLYSREKNFDYIRGSGGEDSSAVGGAKDNSRSQAEMKAAELEEFKSILNLTNDKILVCLNLKGKMVVKDYLISREMLQGFEERYEEGDCLHLAKLYYRERDAKAFVDYITKIADCHGQSKWLPGDQPRRLQFASYWIGWDAHKNDRFQKPGPCIGDHVVLRGASPSPSELQFMRAENLSPKSDPKMIIERSSAIDIPSDYPYYVRTSEQSWYGALDWLFDPEDHDDRQNNDANAFHTLQTVSHLRVVFGDPSQSSPSQALNNNSKGGNGPLSAVWVSMNHQERRKHLEGIESERASKQAELDSRTYNRNYRQSSEPRSEGRILSYGRDHSSHMLNSRKRDA